MEEQLQLVVAGAAVVGRGQRARGKAAAAVAVVAVVAGSIMEHLWMLCCLW
jgi:hypothetical protein